ncbi:cytochrome P450 2J2-like isoform X2 [Pomacea canaliculata]|uniref:cytochrome P450 2J2-like isoform X2 n=1 Tax=Pomacea canaliculata TaxID=400727 RepID=UPI000D728CB5|nr:cytochrome P450 2J2-like isoform X2 [Pomacea canaliculata]
MLGTELLSEIPSLLLLVVLALVSLWWMSTRRPAGVPPGPGFALPLLGHLHLLKSGVVDSSGPVWKAQRKTSLEILRELGMGKNILAEKIQEEVKEYIEAIAKKNGEPQDLTRITQVSVSNNICSIVFGKRFEYEDPVFKGYMQRIEENIQAAGTVAVVQTFPVFRFIPGDPFGVRKIFDNVIAILNTLIKPFIDLHVKNFDENCVDDFISAYLREIRKVQHKPSAEFINEVNLRKVVMDLFTAGTETTSTTIRWAITYFLHHPDVKDRCYEEIHRVVGTERVPTIRDRPELVYMEATILEVLRCSSIVPFSVPHSTATEVQFRGYTIPKGTLITPNLYSVLHAPEVWGDPDNFRPERFIGKDGKLLRFEEHIPFSIGRRACLGEALARMELFLYLAAMIQRFRFLPPETGELPSLQRTYGIIDTPKRYMVRAVLRD